jgi:hypothetical protein
MPGIVRVEHRRHPYVVIDRRPLEDARLSWAARGLLGYLLAKPDDWQLRVSDLCRRGDLGRDGVHSLLRQLHELGYLRRTQLRDERGRAAGYDYTVLEVPCAPGPGSPGPAVPNPAGPDAAEPEPADPPLPSNQGTKDPVNQVTTTTTHTDRGHEPERGSQTRAWHGGNGDVRDRDDRRRRARDAGGRSNARQGPANDAATLEYPPGLSAPESAAAKQQLAGLPRELAQGLLDELAGRMASGGIRGSPLSYLRGLIARAKEGAFTPEAAVTVAAARDQRRRSEVPLERATARAPEFPPADPNNPLVQRALRIRDRARAAAQRAEPEADP